MLRRTQQFLKPTIPQTIAHIKANGAKGFAWEFERPGFNAGKQSASRLEATLATGEDYTKANLDHKDLAAPHRLPYAWFRDFILRGDPARVVEMTEALCRASEVYENAFTLKGTEYRQLASYYVESRKAVLDSLTEYRTSLRGTDEERIIARLKLIQSVNNLASNAPGLGPHKTTNRPVNDRLHVHPTSKRSLSPRSRAALEAAEKHGGNTLRVATSNSGKEVVSVTGARQEFSPLSIPHEDVKGLGNRVFSGILVVDDQGKIFRPKNPHQPPTGDFNTDWELV